jgi:hypothetical protein
MKIRGSISKKKAAFQDALRKYCQDRHVDPHFWMVDLLVRKGVRLELKFLAAKELAQYLQPKLRAVEVSGDPEQPVHMQVGHMTREELETQIVAIVEDLRRYGDPLVDHLARYAANRHGTGDAPAHE